jgi:hypothetical protein
MHLLPWRWRYQKIHPKRFDLPDITASQSRRHETQSSKFSIPVLNDAVSRLGPYFKVFCINDFCVMKVKFLCPITTT